MNNPPLSRSARPPAPAAESPPRPGRARAAPGTRARREEGEARGLAIFQRGLRANREGRTLEALQRGFPGVRFTWLMGADNLAQLHRWDNWREIMERVPVGVLARPGRRMAARGSVAADVYARAQLPARAAGRLAVTRPPAWCFVNVPMIDLSSTELRRASLAKK